MKYCQGELRALLRLESIDTVWSTSMTVRLFWDIVVITVDWTLARQVGQKGIPRCE